MAITKAILEEIANEYVITCWQPRKRLEERFGTGLAEAILNPYKTESIDEDHYRIWFDKNSHILVYHRNTNYYVDTVHWEILEYKEINDEIREAVALIKEKTGIDVPLTVFDVVVDDFLKSHTRAAGCYGLSGIRIRPSIFKGFWIIDPDRYRAEYNKDSSRSVICGKDGKLKRLNEDEYVEWCIETYTELNTKHYLEICIHEAGHWVHDVYFNYKPMYLRGGTRYAHRNGKENFAVAFQQYVMGEIPKISSRYQRMDEIIKSIDRKEVA